VLGQVAVELGDYKEAKKQFEQGLQCLKELGDAWGIAVSCSNLGRLALLTHDYENAKLWLQRSLPYHKQSGQQTRHYFEALLDISQLFAAQKREEDAIELLSCLLNQTYDQRLWGQATASLGELHAVLPAEIYAAAVERGKTLDLDAVVTEFLAT